MLTSHWIIFSLHVFTCSFTVQHTAVYILLLRAIISIMWSMSSDHPDRSRNLVGSSCCDSLLALSATNPCLQSLLCLEQYRRNVLISKFPLPGLLWRNCGSRLPILIILRKSCLVLLISSATNYIVVSTWLWLIKCALTCYSHVLHRSHTSCRRSLWTEDSSSTKLYIIAEISGTCRKLWQCVVKMLC